MLGGTQAPTNIAVIGCGYVADYYLATMANHPSLSVIGVFDPDPYRTAAFASYHDVPGYPDLDAVLGDERVELVLNLTSAENHGETSRWALLAGKHVYSEKPLAMSYDEGEELLKLAEKRQRLLASAPCTLLGEAAQTLWRAIRRGDIGRPQLAYAELDDGAVYRMPYRDWQSASGSRWPYRSEFQTGCTLEHAACQLTWLIAMFGPVTEVSAFAANLIEPAPVDEPAPDFTSSCLRLTSGVAARLTCSVVAPVDHSLRIIGDEGELIVSDVWDFASPVHIRRTRPDGRPQLADPVPYPLVRECAFARDPGSHNIDFARGVAELAEAARQGRPCRLPASHALHALDVTLSMAHGDRRQFSTTLEPVEPMPWAMDRTGAA